MGAGASTATIDFDEPNMFLNELLARFICVWLVLVVVVAAEGSM